MERITVVGIPDKNGVPHNVEISEEIHEAWIGSEPRPLRSATRSFRLDDVPILLEDLLELYPDFAFVRESHQKLSELGGRRTK